jgi:predicted regulator of Ras-like GTPase activity (Roadblock/LC7/MglB family)
LLEPAERALGSGMNDFQAQLRSICSSVQGAVAASIMGIDGIPVTAYEVEGRGDDLDVASLLVEYSSLIGQVQKSAQMFAAGGLEELSITSEHLTMIIRPVTGEYFLALAMRSSANFGKGRYLLRIHAPRLASELS